jgi:hypothetical protein
MKYFTVLLLLFFPLLAGARSGKDKHNQVQDIIAELQDSWTLGIDSNNNAVDINAYNKFKSLFDSTAIIDDDLAFRFVPGKDGGTYVLHAVPREFDEYAHDAALQVIKFRIDSMSEPRKVSGDDTLIYELYRMVYVEKAARYVLNNTDELTTTILGNHPYIRFEKGTRIPEDSSRAAIAAILKDRLARDPDSLYKFLSAATLRIAFTNGGDDANPLKIAGIRVVSSSVQCINDNDTDGILNETDMLPKVYGEFPANGAPDLDLDGVPDVDDKCRDTYGSVLNKGCPESYFVTHAKRGNGVGLQLNTAHIGLPDLNKLGYTDQNGGDATDVLQSIPGSLRHVSPAVGFYLSGSLAYFFGWDAKRTGICVGLTYARFTNSYDLEENSEMVYTYKAFDGHDPYRRQITIASLAEKVTYSVVQIPIQLDYRHKLGTDDKWVIDAKAGPSLMFFTGHSNYKTTVDVGGIYQIDSLSGDKITYYDYFNAESTWNVYLTAAGIKTQNPHPGAAAVFSQLDSAGGLDFTTARVYQGDNHTTRIKVAINLSVDIEYRMKRESPYAMKAGLHLTYAPGTNTRDKYKPIEATKGDFNPIFNSNGNSYYIAYGLNVGFVYDF